MRAFGRMFKLCLAGLLLSACGGSGEQQAQTAGADGRPNVLLLTLDTTRADRFGAYGYDRPTTPNFDALAASGTLFESAMGVSGCTPPAHASIMTGLFPPHHGLRVIFAGSGYRLNPALPSLATLFRDAGFETGAFLSSFTVSEYFGFDTGFGTWDNGIGKKAEQVPNISAERMQWDVAHNQRRSDETARVAANWIRERRKPFFCWVHFWDPHDEQMLPPKEWLERLGQPEAAHVKQQIYDAELAFADYSFGHLVATLRESGLYENTVIVVISDHGQGLGDHDWMFHRMLFEEQVRLPFLISGPGVPSRVRVEELVRSVDLLPTLVDLIDLDFDTSHVDGKTLLGLMNGKSEAPRLAYAEQLNEWDRNSFVTQKRPKDRLLYSVRSKGWKLIYRDNLPDESMLFNLDDDPHELQNLYAQPEGAEARRELLGWLDAEDVYRREAFAGETDAEAEERLRSLGYLGN